MNVVIDTNIVLDAIADRKPFHVSAQAILTMVSEEKIRGFVTSNSITDIYYIIRKHLPTDKAKNVIRSLMYSVEILPVNAENCWQALALEIDDFEDALVSVCAAEIKADFIISRDGGFINSKSPVKVISPDEFLDAKLGKL